MLFDKMNKKVIDNFHNRANDIIIHENYQMPVSLYCDKLSVIKEDWLTAMGQHMALGGVMAMALGVVSAVTPFVPWSVTIVSVAGGYVTMKIGDKVCDVTIDRVNKMMDVCLKDKKIQAFIIKQCDDIIKTESKKYKGAKVYLNGDSFPDYYVDEPDPDVDEKEEKESRKGRLKYHEHSTVHQEKGKVHEFRSIGKYQVAAIGDRNGLNCFYLNFGIATKTDFHEYFVRLKPPTKEQCEKYNIKPDRVDERK